MPVNEPVTSAALICATYGIPTRGEKCLGVLNVTADPSSLLLADAGTGCFHSAAPPSVSQSEAEQRLLWQRDIKRKGKINNTSTKLPIDDRVSNPQRFAGEGCKSRSVKLRELLA